MGARSRIRITGFRAGAQTANRRAPPGWIPYSSNDVPEVEDDQALHRRGQLAYERPVPQWLRNAEVDLH